MEKYSTFKDPLTGVNPFLQPKKKKITAGVILLAIIRYPIYLLYCAGLPVLSLLICIKFKTSRRPTGLVFCNSVTEFDRTVIKRTCSAKTRVKFPEGATTNNQAVLKYNESDCDFVIGLKYNPECVYLYGSRLWWLVCFLGTFNTVEITVLEGNKLSSAVGVPQVTLTKEDKARFMQLLSQHQNVV